MLFKEDLNIISIIGIVLLIGIVKKNAIMMIDFALQAERQEGKSPADSIFDGVHASIPSHPDDDHGGFVWRIASGAGDGNGVGTP